VEMYQVPELLSEEVISKMGATQPKEAMKHIPVITSEIRKDVIKSADAIFFGSPTRFGIMTAQMKSFFDALGGLWFENACVGKVSSCFTGSGTQHGGQETTLFSMITPLLHLGFVYVGLPYSCREQKEVSEVSGGSPYGATFIAGSDGSRAVSPNELACARFQGRHVAQFAKELKAGRLAIGKGLSNSPTPSSVSLPSTTESVKKPSDEEANTIPDVSTGNKNGNKEKEVEKTTTGKTEATGGEKPHPKRKVPKGDGTGKKVKKGTKGTDKKGSDKKKGGGGEKKRT